VEVKFRDRVTDAALTTIRDWEGKQLAGWLLRDITTRAAEEQIRNIQLQNLQLQSLHVKSHFLAIMSHELRSL